MNSSIQLCSIVVLSYHSFVVVQNDLSPFVPILPWSFFWVVGFPRRRKNRMDFFSTPAQDCLSEEWRVLMKTACQFSDQLLALTLQSWHCIYIVMAFGPSPENLRSPHLTRDRKIRCAQLSFQYTKNFKLNIVCTKLGVGIFLFHNPKP